MKEIKRMLKKEAVAYATFFLYSEQTISSAQLSNNTLFNLKFKLSHADGCFINDTSYAPGAVAYMDRKMLSMIDQAGLRSTQPSLKGSWSGALKNTNDGQEVALLSLAS